MTSSLPEDGDLVIRRDTRDGETVYILHAALGAGQYLLRSRGEAIARATAFPRRQRVRVWLTSGDSDSTLIENFRVLR